jgi:hypothetical protein
VARLATRLTTRKGHLPLGAPTSNCLENLALQPCLTNVVKIANEFGFSRNSFGQYSDDIAFSGDTLPDNFISSIVDEFIKYGFKLKSKKIKVMYSNIPQIVTKKLVNRKVSIPKIKRSKIRAAVYGLENTNPKTQEYRKQYRSLRSRINELKAFHSNLAKNLLERFNRLPNPDRHL